MGRFSSACLGLFVGAATVFLGSGLNTDGSALVRALATPSAATPVVSVESGEHNSPYLAGAALPLLPPGEPGVVDVIAVGAPVEWSVPVVVRNTTSEAVLLIAVRGTASDAAGAELATGEAGSFMAPSVLPPGEVALASIYFNSLEHLPPDAELAFEVESEPAATADDFRRDLEIGAAAVEGEELVGVVRNGAAEPLLGKVSVVGVCFDTAGTVTGYAETFADGLDLEPDEEATFTADIAGAGPCDVFLVGASGYKKP
jgi:hypothetical protein